MSGESKKETQQTQSTRTDPWSHAIPSLDEALGYLKGGLGSSQINSAEQGALSGLSNLASNGYNYAPQMNTLATDLFSGGPDRSGYVTTGYNDARSALLPIAGQSTDPWSNKDFSRTADLTTQRAMDAIKSSYAGAGIPAAAFGDFARTAGEGISNALAPLAWNARNDLVGQATGAGKDLYSVGTGTAGALSGLDQTSLGNRVAGIDVGNSAAAAQAQPFMNTLNIESMRRQIPTQNLASIMQMILPIAGLGQQSNSTGTSTTTSQMSPFEMAMMGMKTVGGLPNPFKVS
jgi:hypothetical protein